MQRTGAVGKQRQALKKSPCLEWAAKRMQPMVLSAQRSAHRALVAKVQGIGIQQERYREIGQDKQKSPNPLDLKCQ